MTISYSLAPVPKWYIADLVGRPLGGGYLSTFSNLDHTLLNPVYQDNAGLFAWPYVTVPNNGILGILFDENGAQGPFYFKFDTDEPEQLYYLEVYDSNGVLQWTIDDFTPGGGGGGVVSSAVNLVNLVQNGSFYRNIVQTDQPISTLVKLAPSAHSGLAQSTLQLSPGTNTGGKSAGPDILFMKNAAGTPGTDQIKFQTFPVGENDLAPNGITPVYYLEYDCSVSALGETYKLIQFPITSKVQNLNGQEIICAFWARFQTGTNPQITLNIRQFFGDGTTASPDVNTSFQTFNLTNTWQRFSVTGTIPSILGKNIGTCGNDGLFLQLLLPLNQVCEIWITLPSMYLGNILPEKEYSTNDMIETINDSPRTGDFRISMNEFSPYGWVPMNDGTIGNGASNSTTRSDIDTFPLYNLIWNQMFSNQTYAHMYNSANTAISYGGSSVADFEAGNQISLTKALGSVLAGRTAFLPDNSSQTFTVNFGVSPFTLTFATRSFPDGTPVRLTTTGTLPAGLSAGFTYYFSTSSATTGVLATSPDNVYSGSYVAFSNNGTGTHTITIFSNDMGLNVGEPSHVLTIPEMPAHTHNVASGPTPNIVPAGGSHPQGDTHNVVSSSTGGGGAHNNMQPTLYTNMYIKL